MLLGVLESLFNHIIEGSELLRARAIAFLKEKVLTSKTTLFNPIEDTEKFLALQVRSSLLFFYLEID